MAKKSTKTDRPTCLVCGASGRLRRGLCQTDYERYRRAKERLPEDRRGAYEEECVARGILLPSRQGCRGVEDDVFAQTLAEFQEEKRGGK